MDVALEKQESMGLISDSKGAKLVKLEKWMLGKAVVCKKGVCSLQLLSMLILSNVFLFHLDGTSIYLTHDMGGAIKRYERYKFDKMIYVISSQQDLHLAQFFKVQLTAV